jgi:ABC-type antimicrobial peptide transport system permease subunit
MRQSNPICGNFNPSDKRSKFSHRDSVALALLTDLIDATTAGTWFQARLISAFSLLAPVLAGGGIYGVLAYAVTGSTREIGICMALGANKSDVVLVLLKRAMLLVAVGGTIGGCGALGMTRVLGKFVFEVKPTDPATSLSVAAVLTLVAIIACLLPALRATRLDPVVALRWGNRPGSICASPVSAFRRPKFGLPKRCQLAG